MDEDIRDCWWELIYILADELGKEKIVYSFDDETILFVHGLEFDMDNIDITVQWDCFKKVHDYFSKYNTSEIIQTNFSEFHFVISGFKVYVISSASLNNLEEDQDRIIIDREGHILWSKSLTFYRKHLTLDHPYADLMDLIDLFIDTNDF